VAGAYLLWDWSLKGGHEIIALVSAVALLLSIVMLAWVLAIELARLLARNARRPLRRESVRVETPEADVEVRPEEIARPSKLAA
jgi:hypothetical protein